MASILGSARLRTIGAEKGLVLTMLTPSVFQAPHPAWSPLDGF
jgi:hypothetical protein